MPESKRGTVAVALTSSLATLMCVGLYQAVLPSGKGAKAAADAAAGRQRLPPRRPQRSSRQSESASECMPPQRSVRLARERWEAAYNAPFPGRGWGDEETCSDVWNVSSVARHVWAEDVIGRALPGNGTVLGAEIGPCTIPLVVPRRVSMRYIDFSAESHNRNCFVARHNFVPVSISIVADAQTFATVPEQSFDLLVAFHVLEHMMDVLRALRGWLRSLRPGGVLLLAVPDACSWEQCRLVTSPLHFLQEYDSGMTRAEAEARHRDEAAVTKLVGHLVISARKVAKGEVPEKVNFSTCGWLGHVHATSLRHSVMRGRMMAGDELTADPGWIEDIDGEAARYVYRLSRKPAFDWAYSQL
eukprot:TRINITY_DN4810_c0_g1_i3.p1 TRINITY_DN4810_c0_g1~~TRINITY_DN4810_c0_g1_i3.p1  ORF type:complete len:358 (+),score=113.39 TRINITY_DN4810_c0_g1_i3:109-1182(+)